MEVGLLSPRLQPDQLTELDNRIALTDVLARLQDYPAKRIDAFLPWNWQRCRVQKTFCAARIPKRIDPTLLEMEGFRMQSFCDVRRIQASHWRDAARGFVCGL